MHDFLMVVVTLFMSLMVQLRIMGIFIVLFVLIMVTLKYLMSPNSIVSFAMENFIFGKSHFGDAMMKDVMKDSKEGDRDAVMHRI